MPPHKRSSLPAVTGVRFFLALWVISLHMGTANSSFRGVVDGSPSWIRGTIDSGASAVGVFFLLSGFVLAYNYDLGTAWSMSKRVRFWTTRFARIYPVYLFALVLGFPSLAIGIFKSGHFHAGAFAGASTAVLLLVQAWIPHDALFWNGPGWSLSVEAFFYLCFPFIGRLLWKVERRVSLLFTFIFLWIAACGSSYEIADWKAHWFLSHSSGIVLDTTWSQVIKFDPLVRLPEFLAGIVLCKIFLSIERRPTALLGPGRGTLTYLLGLALGLIVVSQGDRMPPAVLHDGLLMPASAAVILGLSFGGGLIWRWLSRPVIVILGQVSYAMYLLHMPLYTYFAAVDKRVVRNAVEDWALFVIFVISLIALCCVTFYKLEEPSRRAILNAFYPTKPRVREELPLHTP
ncbi:MAG TPA: acyltransferase [Edaphobacter sp.]|uniref:acyltransferase family protein n=1 Tax=Edaphobacter sp. TaxID=1934404 RepID=UPI002B7FA36F|nr:acyltransferase [Edaphobacter sp.]HUZ95080.1 acyltransferase [Edaphobacter sp.]